MKDAGRVFEGQNNTTSADCQQVMPSDKSPFSLSMNQNKAP